MGRRPPMRRVGFTLVEILCVIGIMIGLAGLTFPVFARGRRDAKASVCMSNVRQSGMGILLYSADFDDCFPYGTDDFSKTFAFLHGGDEGEIAKMELYTTLLLPYVGSRSIFQSPLDTGMTVMENGGSRYLRKPTLFHAVGSSYLYSVSAGMRFTGSTDQLSRFPILTSASGAWHCGCADLSHGEGSPARDPYKRDNYRYSISFGDGHAKILSYRQWEALSLAKE